MGMMIHRTGRLLLVVIPLLISCTSSDPAPRHGSMPPAQGASIAGLDLTLPGVWWRDSQVAGSLSLTGEQLQRLDTLQPQQEEVARLERNLMIAAREIRTALESRNATAALIVSASGHFRELQQSLIGKQIETLAAQREILTAEQWGMLQRVLAEQRRPRRPEGEFGPGGPGRGGPGGPGGRRRPPSF